MSDENNTSNVAENSLIHRIRMKLAWWIAPFATRTGLENRLRLIEMDAKEIQECSATPSQPDESARGIERRVNAIQDKLGLERKYDTDIEHGRSNNE